MWTKYVLRKFFTFHNTFSIYIYLRIGEYIVKYIV